MIAASVCMRERERESGEQIANLHAERRVTRGNAKHRRTRVQKREGRQHLRSNGNVSPPQVKNRNNAAGFVESRLQGRRGAPCPLSIAIRRLLFIPFRGTPLAIVFLSTFPSRNYTNCFFFCAEATRFIDVTGADPPGGKTRVFFQSFLHSILAVKTRHGTRGGTQRPRGAGCVISEIAGRVYDAAVGSLWANRPHVPVNLGLIHQSRRVDLHRGEATPSSTFSMSSVRLEYQDTSESRRGLGQQSTAFQKHCVADSSTVVHP
ncbi:hypothetical protein GN956_G20117 [Arapaima gigas]